jgi:ubiquinone/menaquinone biosynthesis C-methylase UbiE
MDIYTNNKELFHQHYKIFASSYDKLRDNRSEITRINAADQIDFVLRCFEAIDEIVEIGCGTGKFTIPLAKAGKRVIAIDYSEEMLEIVREKAITEGIESNIEFRHGDIENLDIPSQSTGGVLSIAVLRHFEDQKKAISELARILNNSGILVIDYLSSLFYKPYDWLKKHAAKKDSVKGQEWFPNYYQRYNSISKMLQSNKLQIIRKRGFVLLPTAVTEKLHIKKPVKYIERKSGLGSVMFIVARKDN